MLWRFIIWQGGVGVNSSVVIGSLLVGILPYESFPWKRSEAVYFFISESLQIQNLPHNKLLSNPACSSRTGEYWRSVGFCTDLAALGPYCHDLGPIFLSTALALG